MRPREKVGAKGYDAGCDRDIEDMGLIRDGGAEYGVRGCLTAYEAASGGQLRRFYMTPNPDGKPDGAASDEITAEETAATWSDGEWTRTVGGRTAWDSIVHDPQRDIVHIGAGNGTVCDAAGARKLEEYRHSWRQGATRHGAHRGLYDPQAMPRTSAPM